MNLFPFQGAVTPTEPGIESIQGRGATRGAQLGQMIPTAGDAIARGISNAIDQVNKDKLTKQGIELNKRKIEAADQALERAEQLDPLVLEQQQMQLEQRREEFAKQTRLRADTEQLAEVLKGQDPQAKVDALMSGRFVELFANVPELHKRTTEVAVGTGLMTPPQLNAVRTNQLDQREAVRRQREFEKLQQQHRSNIDSFETSELATVIKKNSPNARLADAARDITFVPADQYEVNPVTGVRVLDNRGQYVVNSNFNATAIPRFYSAFDKKTGKLVAQYVTPDEKKLTEKAAVAYGSLETPVESIVEEALRRSGYAPGQDRNPQAPPPPVNTDNNIRANVVLGSPDNTPNVLNESISIKQLGNILGRQNLIGINGTIDLSNVPQAPRVLARSLGVPATIADKNQDNVYSLVADMLSTATNTIAPNNDITERPLYTAPQGTANIKQESESLENKKIQLADTLLGEMYDSIKDTISEEEKQRALNVYNSRNTAGLGLVGRSILGNIRDIPKIESYEELYVIQNRPSMIERMNLISRQIQNQALQQQRMRVSGPAVAQTISDIINKD